MKFRLLHFFHRDASGHTFNKGDIVESNSDLSKCFPLKFEKLTTPASVDVTMSVGSAVSSPVQSPAAPATRKAGETSPFGEDVSEDFPVAETADLKVYQKGRSFFVVDPDSAEESLNEKALKGSEVEKFIKAYLKN